MKINNSIWSAWNNRINTVNFFRIFFKICQCNFNPQFICICQNMKYRICRSGYCHIKHNRILQYFFRNEIFWRSSGFCKLNHVFTGSSCRTESCIVRCRNCGSARHYQIQDFSKHLHRIGSSHRWTCTKRRTYTLFHIKKFLFRCSGKSCGIQICLNNRLSTMISCLHRTTCYYHCRNIQSACCEITSCYNQIT